MPLVNDPQVVPDQYIVQGRVMRSFTVNRPSGAVGNLRLTIQPLLPQGLLLSGGGVISGTPESTLPRTLFTITWTDDVGDTASKSFNLEVISPRRVATALDIQGERPDLSLNVGRVVSEALPRPVNGVPPYDVDFEKADFTIFDLTVTPTTRVNAEGWEPRVPGVSSNPSDDYQYNLPGLTGEIRAFAWRRTGRGSFGDNVFIAGPQNPALFAWLQSLPGGWEIQVGPTVFDGSTATLDKPTAYCFPSTTSPFTIGTPQRLQIRAKAIPDRPAGLSVRDFTVIGSPTAQQPLLPYEVTYTDRLGVTGSVDFNIQVGAASAALAWPVDSLPIIDFVEGEIVDPYQLPKPSGGSDPDTVHLRRR